MREIAFVIHFSFKCCVCVHKVCKRTVKNSQSSIETLKTEHGRWWINQDQGAFIIHNLSENYERTLNQDQGASIIHNLTENYERTLNRDGQKIALARRLHRHSGIVHNS